MIIIGHPHPAAASSSVLICVLGGRGGGEMQAAVDGMHTMDSSAPLALSSRTGRANDSEGLPKPAVGHYLL
jgi:hypothetical protein